MSRISGNLVVDGALSVTGSFTPPDNSVSTAKIVDSAVTRAKIAQDDLAAYGIPLTEVKTWDDMATNLPGAAASDDLALITGTLGTTAPTIQTGDLKDAGATTRYGAFLVALPAEYQAGESVQIRVRAGMDTTVASAAATVDIQAYKIDGDGGVSADLCSTAAQSINSLTEANKDFAIDATNLAAGDVLHVRIAVAVNDSGTNTAVIGKICALALLCDIRG